jgi:LysM repeat protein
VSGLALSLQITGPVAAAETHPKKTTIKAPVHLPEATGGTVVAASASVPTEYTVADGDTISGIAARMGLATADILALNGLGWSSLIFPGQVLALAGPVPVEVPAATGQDETIGDTGTSSATEQRLYTVQSGDTIGAIAAANGLSTASVLQANGLTERSLIFSRQQIILPGGSPATPGTGTPAPAQPAGVTPLTAEMRANASTIIAIGRAAGVPDQGLVIALAAAAQESGLVNVGYGDRDSLGLFQQRPSAGWGSPAEVQDPIRASLAFFGGPGNPNPGVTRGLLDVPGWQSLSVTDAAQAVQISAWPTLYAKWETSARAWLAELS